MNYKKGALAGVILALLVFWAAEEFIFWGPARQRWKQVAKADHAAILDGCRQVMASHRKSGAPTMTISRMDVGRFTRLPPSILNLEPVNVRIAPDEVRICLFSMPRLYVVGFSTNALQYGAERLVDGLWFSRDPEEELKEASAKADAED